MAGELITRDGQLQFGDLLIGPGTPFEWVDLEGWRDRPDVDTGNQPRVGHHGDHLGDLLAQSRKVTLKTQVLPGVGRLSDAVRALRRATGARQDEIPLVVQLDGAKEVAWARVLRRSIPVDQDYWAGAVQAAVIQWEATDSRIYSLETLSASTRLPRPGAGFTYPLQYPIDYGAEGNPGSVQVTNDGDADAPTVLTITGGAPQPVIINARTGARLELDLTLTDRDELAIDTREGTVLLNGVNRLYALTARSDDPGDFLLAEGVNDIQFRAAAPSDTALLTVAWQHAHL